MPATSSRVHVVGVEAAAFVVEMVGRTQVMDALVQLVEMVTICVFRDHRVNALFNCKTFYGQDIIQNL